MAETKRKSTRRYTDDDFDIMIAELTGREPRFDKLFEIAEATLMPWIKSRCASSKILRGREADEEIMQRVRLRLSKSVVTRFLFKEDCEKLNRDPDGFKSWMFTMAKRIFRDTETAYGKYDQFSRGFEDWEEDTLSDSGGIDEDAGLDYARERLNRAFGIVLDSDKKAYIVLTWLVQSLHILDYDCSKIWSTRKMEEELGKKTLFEMRDMALELSGRLPWLEMSESRLKKLDRSLEAESDGVRLGDRKYSEFFMEKGVRKSISDWVNRVNAMIEKIMGDGQDKPKKPKKPENADKSDKSDESSEENESNE